MENKEQEVVLKHRESERRRRKRIKDKLNIIDEMTTGSTKSTLEQERILNQAIQHIQQLHDFINAAQKSLFEMKKDQETDEKTIQKYNGWKEKQEDPSYIASILYDLYLQYYRKIEKQSMIEKVFSFDQVIDVKNGVYCYNTIENDGCYFFVLVPEQDELIKETLVAQKNKKMKIHVWNCLNQKIILYFELF